MLDTLRMLIADSLPTAGELDPPIQPGDLRVAACALMLQVAYADGRFTRDERAVITKTLTSYFGLDERGALDLMAEAERQLELAADEASFTRQLIAEYDDEQRRVLSDFFWEVARADGWIGDNEAFVASKLSGWIGVVASKPTSEA